MATLRSNLLLSTAAMVLVGLIRPGFNAIVNRVFGPEVNAHANALIAVIFIASLPATAALPTVMVRHVSRALGAGNHAEAAGHTRLSLLTGLALVGLSAVGVTVWSRFDHDLALTQNDLVITIIGIAGYTAWRLQRTLLVAIGHAKTSLIAELIGVGGMFATLIALVILEEPTFLVGAVVLTYVVYTLLVVPLVVRYVEGAALDEEGRRSFFRYNLIWFLGSASSLAARELTMILLFLRVKDEVVGDVSVAMSLLMLLAFAPRVIEVPLVHELSQMGAEQDIERQRALASKGTHWLTIFTFAAACGATIVAEPLLSTLGGVKAPVAPIAFAILSGAFMIEMMMTPATNLLIAEAPPSVLTWIGVISLLVGFVWWALPWSQTGALGVIAGLALSYAVKGVGIGWYASRRLGVIVFERPAPKIVALIVGVALATGALSGTLQPYLAFVAFEVAIIGLFTTELFEVRRAILGR